VNNLYRLERSQMGKWLKVVIVAVLVVMLATGIVGCGGEKLIPDPNLEAGLGKTTGDITKADLEGLSEIHACCRGITDLTGLEYCTSLKQLDLSDNQIVDISPLSGLTSLQMLWLQDNQINDIEALVNNTGLSEGDTVDLTDNPLSTTSINTYIPQLEARGVEVIHGD